MSDFNQFIQYRALAFKFDRQNIDITEHFVENAETGEAQPIPLRNVCAKLTVELAERIDNVASVLGVTKRLFIEKALIDAMDRANAMLEEVGAWEGLEDNAGADQ